MLVLTRKKGETVMIGDDIEIVVLGSEGEAVKIGIRAPKHVDIHRKEVYLAILESNREASAQPAVSPAKLSELLKKRLKQ